MDVCLFFAIFVSMSRKLTYALEVTRFSASVFLRGLSVVKILRRTVLCLSIVISEVVNTLVSSCRLVRPHRALPRLSMIKRLCSDGARESQRVTKASR